MCLIAVAWRVHPRYPLVLIANRDESHARASAEAGLDPEAPAVYGGRDLIQGGGWLQVSTRGRLAAVTNVRAGTHPEAKPRSRGLLVRDFVRGTGGAPEFAAALAPSAGEFGRFNLLLWDGAELVFASNHPRATHAAVSPGLHAMSNGAFDAPWPKSGHATRALAAWLDSAASHADALEPATLTPLFAALGDTTSAPDNMLPDTGVGLALERTLSPPFVLGERYGTRCSSVVLLARDRVTFAERRFGPMAAPAGESAVTLPFSGAPSPGP
jgi:uncharacterized protein with NRDE domain